MPALDPTDLANALKGSPVLQRELARLLRTSPSLRSTINNIVVALAHDVTVGKQVGFGSGQNDTFVNRDNVDSTHPMNLSYLIPSNSQRVVSARLSWRLHAYRTYSSLTLSSTGAGTSHGHGGESGHSHGHAHSSANHTHHNTPAVGGPGAFTLSNGSGLQVASGPAGGWDTDSTTPGNTGSDSTGSSGHGHSNEASHTHSVSGTTTLGIAEGSSATGIAISFDGVDKTAKLGGPWSTDVVELDVTPFLTLNPVAAWHTITLASATLGQIESHLRIAFYANAGAPS